jgi:hypothetical protein
MARDVVSSFTVQASLAAFRASRVVVGEAPGRMRPWREAERLGSDPYREPEVPETPGLPPSFQ